MKERLRKLVTILDRLPEEALQEADLFVGYLQYKHERERLSRTPYRPVALSGLWQGLQVSDEDIAQARGEMWGRLAEQEP